MNPRVLRRAFEQAPRHVAATGGLVVMCWAWLGLPAGGQTTNLDSSLDETLLREQKHFTACLIYGYSPALWISHHGALYFMPKNDAQLQTIERLKAERADYVAFTNLAVRHAFAEQLLASSGVDSSWQTRLLLPWSPTNRNLTPTLDRSLRLMPTYTLLQNLRDHDALLQEGKSIYFVMDYGRATADAFRTNGLFILEGTKTYRTVAGVSKTVEAFTDAGLNREETDVLNRVVTALRQKTASLDQAIGGIKAKEQFEQHRTTAREDNPYMEFLLATDYLEGKGTEKDQTAGLQWMTKAATDGSGDAAAYLAKLKPRQP